VGIGPKDEFEGMMAAQLLGRPIAELLAVVRRIENRSALDTAHRALGDCGQVP
jgi:hypothetical protein